MVGPVPVLNFVEGHSKFFADLFLSVVVPERAVREMLNQHLRTKFVILKLETSFPQRLSELTLG